MSINASNFDEDTVKDKELTVGDSFDPKKDVTAKDIEDGDLTNKIVVNETRLDLISC